MVNKITNIKERVVQVIEIKRITKETFFEKIGTTSANFRGKAKETPLNSTTIENIITELPDISLEWLLTGKGEMFKSPHNYTYQATEQQNFAEAIVSYDRKRGIPLVSIAAIAGFGNSSFAIQESDVKDYYVVPKFKDRKIDFMIEISGSSMYPKYNSGDVVACTILRESRFIQWNKVHVIGTQEQGILVKRIRKTDDDNSFLLVSDNTAYDPFVISCDEITGIAIVVGVIRLE